MIPFKIKENCPNLISNQTLTTTHMQSEEMDFTTAPCEWTDKDDDIIADYLVLKELGLKNSPTLHD